MGRTPTARQTEMSGAELNSAKHGNDTFLLYCPENVDESELLEAVHALYYLPLNFKLLVVEGTLGQKIQKIMAWTDKNIIDRIQFTKQTGTHEKEASPFFYADAVVFNDETTEDYTEVATPHVTVSRSTKSRGGIESDKHRGYRVPADCPEAMATAVLKIARTAA